jgi:hypothetical protein
MPTPSIDEFVLSNYPTGSELIATGSYRPGYRAYPMRVSMRTPGGATAWCVVKHGDRMDRVERERRVLTALKEIGLAVLRVLAGPTDGAYREGVRPTFLVSELAGRPLPWASITSRAPGNAILHQRRAGERLRPGCASSGPEGWNGGW